MNGGKREGGRMRRGNGEIVCVWWRGNIRVMERVKLWIAMWMRENGEREGNL